MVAVLNARANCINALEDKLVKEIVKHLSSYPNLQEDFDNKSNGVFTRSILVRSLFFERCLINNAPSVGQIILLSSGLDTRALQIKQCNGKRIFNVDHPSSQMLSKTIFKEAGINDASYTYLPFDLNKDMDDFGKTLVDHEFKHDIPTLVIWEGSTFYFEPKTVWDVLAWFYRNVSQLKVYFDFANKNFYQKAMLENTGIRSQSELLKQVGEPWQGLFTTEEMDSYARELGFNTNIIDRTDLEKQMLGETKLPLRSIYFAELVKEI
jgi:methyltransferase (TIGR00027 family)